MGIFVLGMHRSGTSALARSLGLLVGYEASQDVGPGNEVGQWEDGVLRRINERLLVDAGGDWSAPPDDVYSFLPISQAGEEGNEFIRAMTSLGPEPWVWKDPRNCLTLPLWLAAAGAHPTFVIVVRHPLEVAKSLQARNGLPLLYGVALWERYNRVLVSTLRAHEAFIIAYGNLLSQPDDTLWRVGEWLRTRGYDVRSGAAAAVQSRLRHSSESDDYQALEAAGVAEPQINLYRWLVSVSGSPVVMDPAVALSMPETCTTADFLATRRQLLYATRKLSLHESRRRTLRSPRRLLKSIGRRIPL